MSRRSPSFQSLNVKEGLIGHGLSVFGDALAVKCGLGEAALLEPEVAFGGEQAFAEKALSGVAQAGTFFKFLRLADEDFLDQVGIAEKDARLKEQGKVNDVAVFAGDASEEAGGIVEKFGGTANNGPAAGAGRPGMRGVRGGAWRFRRGGVSVRGVLTEFQFTCK